MLLRTATSAALLLLGGWQAMRAMRPGAQEAPRPLWTGRCALGLPLDAGEGFDRQRFLVIRDRTYLFEQEATGRRWRLRASSPSPLEGVAAGLFRTRLKWRDGALWRMAARQILKWDPSQGQWLLKAEPLLEFMDFEVDMSGRILLVATGDPATHRFRALLEVVAPGGRHTRVLSPYPDPGAEVWRNTVAVVAATSLQAGFESVQIRDFTVLFNPLSRRLFLFRPLEDRLQEVKLGLPLRGYADLARPGPLDDLCWQVLPGDGARAWVVLKHGSGGPGAGLAAIPLELETGKAGTAQALPGLSLPVFPDPAGNLVSLADALRAYTGGPAREGDRRPEAKSSFHSSPGAEGLPAMWGARP